MSTEFAHEDDASILSPASPNRQPLQGRSKASLARILSATRALMLERGSEDFTLQDVSKLGNVSIGSIYLRFDGKDALVRSVLSEFLQDLSREEDAMMAGVQEQSRNLGELVPLYVVAYAEILRKHAPLLRLAMERASFDPLVSEPGKRSAFRSEQRGADAMLAYADEFGGGDKALKARSSYHVIFATLARQLSLGSTGESVHDTDWEIMKQELGKMCLAYLRAD